MQLKNKVVVITGTSCGLGQSLSLEFSKEQARLVLCSRSPATLDRTASQTGGIAFPADVTDEKQVSALALLAVEKFGKIDIWINNIGI